MRMQRVLIVVITGALLGIPSLSTVAASETEVRVVGSIGAGGHVSWPGPADPQTAKVEKEKCVPEGAPSDDRGPCWTYGLNGHFGFQRGVMVARSDQLGRPA
jgi:hypothetical protein